MRGRGKEEEEEKERGGEGHTQLLLHLALYILCNLGGLEERKRERSKCGNEGAASQGWVGREKVQSNPDISRIV